MARLIFDTGVLVDAYRGRLDPATIPSTDNLAVPALAVAEYLQGVLLTSDPERAAAQRAFLAEVLDVAPVLDYTVTVAHEHASLLAHVRRSGAPRGAHDLIIAAIARASDRIVLTTDRRAHFEELPGVDVRVVSP